MAQIKDAVHGDTYIDRLGKILPAELTAVYFLLRSLAGTSAQLTPYLFILALVLTLVFFLIAPRLLEMATQRNRVLYCVTFLFWVLAIDPQRFVEQALRPPEDVIPVAVFLISGAAAIWSFAAPFLMDERQ